MADEAHRFTEGGVRATLGEDGAERLKSFLMRVLFVGKPPSVSIRHRRHTGTLTTGPTPVKRDVGLVFELLIEGPELARSQDRG
jgi:hypothetical protein